MIKYIKFNDKIYKVLMTKYIYKGKTCKKCNMFSEKFDKTLGATLNWEIWLRL